MESLSRHLLILEAKIERNLGSIAVLSMIPLVAQSQLVQLFINYVAKQAVISSYRGPWYFDSGEKNPECKRTANLFFIFLNLYTVFYISNQISAHSLIEGTFPAFS